MVDGQFLTQSHTDGQRRASKWKQNSWMNSSLPWIQIRALSFISFGFLFICAFDFFCFYFFLSHTSHLPFSSYDLKYPLTHIVSLSCHFGPPKAHTKHLRAHFDYRHFEVFFFVVCSLMWSFRNAFTSLRLILPTGTCISWVRVQCARCASIKSGTTLPASQPYQQVWHFYVCSISFLFVWVCVCVVLIIGFEFYIKCIPSSLHQPRADTLYRLTVELSARFFPTDPPPPFRSFCNHSFFSHLIITFSLSSLLSVFIPHSRIILLFPNTRQTSN